MLYLLLVVVLLLWLRLLLLLLLMLLLRLLLVLLLPLFTAAGAKVTSSIQGLNCKAANHCHGALKDDNAVDAWSSPAKSEWSPPMHRSAPTRRVKGCLKDPWVQHVNKLLRNL